MTLLNATNTFGTDYIFNYFDLTGSINIESSYDEIATNNQVLKSNESLAFFLRHVGKIGYNISTPIYSRDIADYCVPKCKVGTGTDGTFSYTVPTLTNRIIFLLQAPGGFGGTGSSSPNNNGGGGGAGAMAWGYIERYLNRVTQIEVTLSSPPVRGGNQTESKITFTGGTSVVLTCTSGVSPTTTNVGGTGGSVSYSNGTGVTPTHNFTAASGSNSNRAQTVSPYKSTITSADTYYPLQVGDHGSGGAGGGYGSSGAQGSTGMWALWYII